VSPEPEPDEPLWRPSPGHIATANLTRVLHATGRADYDALHAWSLAEPGAFWRTMWDTVGLIGDRGGDERAFVPATSRPPSSMREARFFPDAKLNVAENLLAGHGMAQADPTAPALIFRGEDGRRVVWSWEQLRATAARIARALHHDGVAPGDRVVAWMPNIPEAVALMLGATSIGAVFSSTSPDFGVEGVIDRFGQIEPVVLVAAASYRYGGKRFECLDRLAEIVERLPTLRRSVVIDLTDGSGPELGAFGARPSPPSTTVVPATPWESWLATDATPPTPSLPTPFERFPSDHPWYVLYSSGTTGPPKCIVHRTGGVLLKHLVEHQLHCNVRPGDRVMYFTTTGWMMWNWLVSALASGATVVLYDGSPFHPGPEALFRVADKERLTLLGISAKFIDSLRKAGYAPREHHALASLRTICSTGSPLSAESFAFVYEAISDDVHLASISGGTDLCGCLVAGDPTAPVYAGEIQRAALGMAVEVWDDVGRPVVGERGELVCTRPFPSMPLGFWGDEDGRQYHRAYFERFPPDGPSVESDSPEARISERATRAEVWAQGDFATRTFNGGFVIHGRSDTTLNPGGVRIGTAEIYRQVEQIPEVLESLVFGQELRDPTGAFDTEIVLLVRLAASTTLTDDLEGEIRRRIRTGCTPRHVPRLIVAVDDLPRTRSGKLAELAVSDVVNGRAVRNTEALANPETLHDISERVRACRSTGASNATKTHPTTETRIP
jgi:acetoacetyl-CoA synthetase